MMTKLARRAVLSRLRDLDEGRLRIACADGTYEFGAARPRAGGDLDGEVFVSNDRLFLRALLGADIGFGESYMDGDWESPDLVSLIRLLLRNRQATGGDDRLAGFLHRLAGGLARRLRDNSIAGSRRHIRRHYDLGNDFFRLFLDRSLLMYSSAYFQSADDTLESAQARKVDRICRQLALTPEDHVLEIGSGWGGFAAWASTRYGCRVTTTTISEEQYRHVLDWQAASGTAGARVKVLKQDYRELTARYDKIVSIEMFEAVGLRHYDDYFGAVDRLLTPDGSMLLQTITVSDQWFPSYHGTADWIEKYIFPGGELASLGEIGRSLARATSLSLYQAENFGTHYARTLHAWRERFHANLDRVRALGFDERFIRMWDFYLASCEAAFLERHTGVYQLLLMKNGARRPMFNEPWDAHERETQQAAPAA